MSKRILQNDKTRTYFHIVKRALILFLLGLIAGGHLLHFQFADMPVYNNVLEYIGIGYLVCAILVLNTTILMQFILTVVLLLLYWAIFLFIPVPGWQGEIFSGQMNLAVYIDDIVLGPCRLLVLYQICFWEFLSDM
jgi:predicted acyltransferase